MEGRVERATFPDEEISHDVAVPSKLKLAEDARAPSDPYSGQPVNVMVALCMPMKPFPSSPMDDKKSAFF